MSSGKGNQKQYYIQEGTKFIQNQTKLPCKAVSVLSMNNEDDIISPFTTYHKSYTLKQDIIHQNAKRFNEDCVAFDFDLQDLENNIAQSSWEMVAPNI